MSAPSPLEDDDHRSDGEKLAELRRAFKETVINMERLIEQAERFLARARERLDALNPDEEC